ncbi:chondroitin sulfate proteoglycan 5 isoform X2 [Electrophorus electricus]|uniref:chondroitin sulfate proteoglycan 5 isoform X2 n=1 Tax=Electrophorus electricus TaxID=8005 RepID=UPI0015D0CC03|nr:chondroitin sulfate proteoglycan 5 isoform X2 [Electrophorus electricus]
MSIFEMGLCSRCWRLSVMPVLLVLLLVSLFARANSVMGNSTKMVTARNGTSLPVEDENAKLAEISKVTKSTGTMYLFPRSGRKPRQEEPGSGLPGEDLQMVTTAPEKATPDQGQITISLDSAETDHLLPHQTAEEDIEEEEESEHATVESPWKGVQAEQEKTVYNLDRQESLTTPTPAASPSHPAEVLTVDFTGSHGRKLVPPSPSAHELQGHEPTVWTMPNGYNYLNPYLTHDNAVSPTLDEYSATADTYEKKLTTTPPPRPFVPRFPSPTVPDGDEGPPATPHGDCQHGFIRSNGTCRSQCDAVPSYCFNGGQCYVLEGTGVFCRCNIQDYVWHKGARCESVITEFQVLCIAVGASALTVLLLFMIIVCFAKKLHVLKTENNKLRKRSKYRPSSEQHNDNFSLSTIAEGSHPNVRKLCDTPPSLPHARALAYYDNIICQDDPTAQNKLEEPVKAPPPKEDETLNIQNSLTPKHENHKMVGEENSSEVNSLQNNMM